MAAAFLVPLVVMAAGSLRPAGLPPEAGIELLPDGATLENYPAASKLVDIPRHAANSLLVVVVAVPLSVLFGSWAGFAISRLSRRAAGVFIVLSVVALMVPTVALIVGRFTLFRVLGVTDTYVPLIAPALIGMSPFYVLVFAWAFRRLPADLFDAATLEGMSLLSMWRRVAMPLVRPVMIGIAVLVFVVTWSNFIDPLIYLSDQRLATLPLALRSLSLVPVPEMPLMLAGAVVATLPVVVAFFVVQRVLLGDRPVVTWREG